MVLSINIAGGFPEGFRCYLPRDAGVVWLANINRYGYFAEPIKGWSGIDILPKEERNFDRSGYLRRLRSHDARGEKRTEKCRICIEGSVADIGSVVLKGTLRQGFVNDAPVHNGELLKQLIPGRFGFGRNLHSRVCMNDGNLVESRVSAI